MVLTYNETEESITIICTSRKRQNKATARNSLILHFIFFQESRDYRSEDTANAYAIRYYVIFCSIMQCKHYNRFAEKSR